MSLLNGEREHIEGGQVFDVAAGSLATGAVGICAYRIAELLQNQPPEWLGASIGTTVLAAPFVYIAIHEFNIYHGRHQTNSNQ